MWKKASHERHLLRPTLIIIKDPCLTMPFFPFHMQWKSFSEHRFIPESLSGHNLLLNAYIGRYVYISHKRMREYSSSIRWSPIWHVFIRPFFMPYRAKTKLLAETWLAQNFKLLPCVHYRVVNICCQRIADRILLIYKKNKKKGQ